MSERPENERTVAEIVSDLKAELKQFIDTRVQLLKQETGEKLNRLKLAGILGAVALVLLITSYLLITLGLAALIAALFVFNPFHWVIGLVAVGVLWGLFGGLAAYFAIGEIKTLRPKKTIEVLKDDKKWLEGEIKTQA